jgi:nucleotide-binding universal stress UspA family protein
VKSGRSGAARAIEAAAERHGADLIVAGAFSRSRVREWVLGGVTQDLIEGCGKFVLLSH